MKIANKEDDLFLTLGRPSPCCSRLPEPHDSQCPRDITNLASQGGKWRPSSSQELSLA